MFDLYAVGLSGKMVARLGSGIAAADAETAARDAVCAAHPVVIAVDADTLAVKCQYAQQVAGRRLVVRRVRRFGTRVVLY